MEFLQINVTLGNCGNWFNHGHCHPSCAGMQTVGQCPDLSSVQNMQQLAVYREDECAFQSSVTFSSFEKRHRAMRVKCSWGRWLCVMLVYNMSLACWETLKMKTTLSSLSGTKCRYDIRQKLRTFYCCSLSVNSLMLLFAPCPCAAPLPHARLWPLWPGLWPHFAMCTGKLLSPHQLRISSSPIGGDG